jgi:hypothetical protein
VISGRAFCDGSTGDCSPLEQAGKTKANTNRKKIKRYVLGDFISETPHGFLGYGQSVVKSERIIISLIFKEEQGIFNSLA